MEGNKRKREREREGESERDGDGKREREKEREGGRKRLLQGKQARGRKRERERDKRQIRWVPQANQAGRQAACARASLIMRETRVRMGPKAAPSAWLVARKALCARRSHFCAATHSRPRLRPLTCALRETRALFLLPLRPRLPLPLASALVEPVRGYKHRLSGRRHSNWRA